MNTKLIENLQRKKKEYGIYLIRRLDCNSKGKTRSYCVSFMKKKSRSFEMVVKNFNNCLKKYAPEGSQIEYSDKMFVVHVDNNVYCFCLEAYKKSADLRGYMEDGSVKICFLHRVGVEQAIRRVRKYRYQYWQRNNVSFCSENVIDEIKKRMSDAELVEWYPNHADRFIASYNVMKEQQKVDTNYIKGIL